MDKIDEAKGEKKEEQDKGMKQISFQCIATTDQALCLLFHMCYIKYPQPKIIIFVL